MARQKRDGESQRRNAGLPQREDRQIGNVDVRGRATCGIVCTSLELRA